MKFTDILDQYSIPYITGNHHHCRPGWIQLDCPFCTEKGSHKWRMGYSIEDKYTNCWVCGNHSLLEVIASITNTSFHESRKLIQDISSSYEKKIVKQGILKYPKDVKPMTASHKKYLIKRGFDPDLIAKRWDVQGIGLSSSYSWRLFLPITYQGEVVSWTTRSLTNEGSRYINAPAEDEKLSLKKILYGQDFAVNSIIIVEGPLDVWKIGPGAVCTFGLSYTMAQVRQMIKFPRRAVCFDNEPEAQIRANKLINDLSVFGGENYNIVLDSKDAGEAEEKELKKLRKFLQE